MIEPREEADEVHLRDGRGDEWNREGHHLCFHRKDTPALRAQRLAHQDRPIGNQDPFWSRADLNYDAGTMNPFIHGEVFVLDDGCETDMDIGTYERFLNIDLTGKHNITTGQIYFEVIEKERKGDYLGQCVQIIPHITDEIKQRIRETAKKSGVEIIIVECGGTVGDIEGLPFFEAFRQIMLEEPRENTASIHVTLVPKLETVGEQKTKPTQHSVQELRRIGIQPDIIIARSKSPITLNAKKKISLFTNVPESCVFSLYDVKEIYSVPSLLEDQGFSGIISKILELKIARVEEKWRQWNKVVEGYLASKGVVNVALGGKYVALSDSYVSVKEAVRHACAHLGVKLELVYIDTEEVEKDPQDLIKLNDVDAVIIPGGFGKRGAEGKIKVAEYALKNSIPFLGLCFGFQLAVVMFARSMLGLKEANSFELNPETTHPVIDLMKEQREIEAMGATMRLGGYEVGLAEGSLARSLYGKDRIRVRHRHRYTINPKYEHILEEKGLIISGRSILDDRAEVIEVSNHPFFLATQFHPEFTSRPEAPDAAYLGLIRAAINSINQ